MGPLSAYAVAWNKWFVACKGNRENGEVNLVTGGNGIWLLILSLAWWAKSLTEKSSVRHYSDLIGSMGLLEDGLEAALQKSLAE